MTGAKRAFRSSGNNQIPKKREAVGTALNIAEVAVEGLGYHFDKPYSYSIPDSFGGRIVPGARVFVPFGRGDRRRQGIVIAVRTQTEPEEVCKPLLAAEEGGPLIDENGLALAAFVRERTFCTLYEALRLLLPAGVHMRAEKQYRLSPSLIPAQLELLTPDERRVTEQLSRAREPLPAEKLLGRAGLKPDSPIIHGLLSRGILMENDAFEEKNAVATENMLRVAALPEDKPLTPKQQRVVDTLGEFGSATVKETIYFSGASQSVVSTLVRRGVLEIFERRVFRNPYPSARAAQDGPAVLSPEQRRAYDNLLERYRRHEGSASLLFGITGSGKTLVFLSLIEDVVRDGRGVIVLVPEISLTPQTVSQFYARFGNRVAVLHSGLSVGERLDEWERVRAGKASIVVGTRSAVFAPVHSLGLIVVDEEQEHTYKSESSPRYHARDIARFRCAQSRALLVLSSATPSLETFCAAKRGRYGLERLGERYGEAVLPAVEIVDMKQELAAGNASPVSRHLLEGLKTNVSAGRQSILLLNRRGYNTFVSCSECGHVLLCPHCSIPLTYHAANGRLMCHYCGHSAERASECPECASSKLRYGGAGTQKIESALSEMLPEARVMRMDTDTTFSKFSHERLLGAFAGGEYDILIGTQMVAKGLNFPNVTLVGVLSADQMLYLNDFRAGERTFALLTQVVGRSGRGEAPGRAVIQTSTPGNPVIALAARQDYEAFYEDEMKMRRLLVYPPYCDICEIGFTGENEAEVIEGAKTFSALLEAQQKKAEGLPLRVMGPMPANIVRVSSRYRYKIVLKCRAGRPFRTFLSQLLSQYGREKISRRTAVFADVNPLTNF